MGGNVEGVLLRLQASLALLSESGNDPTGGSSVVNVSSTAELRRIALNTAYCASKVAETLLSKSAAEVFAALGYPIRANSTHPGGIEIRIMDSILARYVELDSQARWRNKRRPSMHLTDSLTV